MSVKQHKVLTGAMAVAIATFAVWAIALAQGVSAQAQGPVPQELIAYPDMVLLNGVVLTADRDDENFTVAQGVAIREGKFLATGTTAQMKRLVGPATKVIDLKGGSVVPGFIDTHDHLHEYSMRWLGKDDRRQSIRFKDLQSGLQEIKAMVDKAKPGEWVVTNTRPYSARAMNVDNLDPISPNNPVSIEISSEEHVVNSLALKRLFELGGPDIVGVTKDPKTGKPTGNLRDVASGMMTYEVLPWPDPPIPKFKEILKKEMLLENSWGITQIVTRITSEALTALNEMRREDKVLPIRWNVGLPFPHLNPRAEQYFQRLGDMDGMGDDYFRINGISFFSMDSAIGRGGAWTLEAKRKLLPGDMSGDIGVSREVNLPLITMANRYGWAVKSIHSAGDRANSVLLAEYEKADKQNPIKDRHYGIDHGPMLNPDHVKKMAELGVIPSVQMKYVFSADNDNLSYQYGPESLHKMTIVKTIIDGGIKMAAGADTGDEPMGHPLWNLSKMVTRTDDKGRMWGGAQAIDRRIALLTYTRWAARYSENSDRFGSIEKGKTADLVVLGDNYLTVPPTVLADLPVKMTVVGGKVVYDRDRDGVIKTPERQGRSGSSNDSGQE